MNNTQEHVDTSDEEHHGFIKTPRQLIVTVILAFIVPIAVIIMLVSLVAAGNKTGAGSDAMTHEAIAARIKPVAGFNLVDANAPKVFKTGQQVFDSTCTACHTSGAAGAPKIGDNAAWAPFIKTGYEELVKNAIHGIGAMPPKGGNPSLDDFEVARAVVYMANKSGASFEEPKEPAGDKAKEGGNAAAAPAAPQAAAPAAAPAPQAAPAAPQAAAPAAPAPAAAAPAPAQPAPKAEAQAPGQQSAGANVTGEKIYKSVCFACHATGAAGAPKFGDKAAWEPFIKTGMDAMLQNAIHGVGAMPPRGGSQASDAEIKAAIEYMVDAAK